MTLTKDFNISPYYDDFDENKGYYKILFKPAVALQARELTQLQTLLQEQVSKFGSNILREGTIVKGGNFVEINNLSYIKLLDNDTTGNRFQVNNLVGQTIIGSVTGLKALIIATAPGLQTQKPDLNTLYIKYLNTVNDIKVFNNTENINIIDPITSVVDYTISGIIAGSVDTGTSPAVGTAYGVKCGDGVIYQKGYFIKFFDDLSIVSKYSTAPDGVVIGFKTDETIITSNQDSTLLDNANGFNNFNAPGADRLKLTPKLVTKTLAEALSDETFFSIQEYVGGRVVRRNVNTEFNSIQKLVEKRTSEESGNYYVNKFPISVVNSAVSANNVTLTIGSGIGYVEGKRIETLSDTYFEVAKPQGFNQVNNQDVVANFGQYVIVNTVTSPFVITNMNAIDLQDNVGSIGSARIRSFTKIDNSTYRAYIFDIRMNSGKLFSNVTKLIQSTSSATVVLESGKAVLKDISSSLLFSTGRSYIKSIIDASSDYYYKGYISVSSGAGTTLAITLPVGSTWPYSGSLNSIQLNELIVINDTDNVIVTSFTASVSGQTLTISGVTTGKTYGVYYNAKNTTLQIAQKTKKTVYVKINCSGNAGGIYGLGLSDAITVKNIWKGTTYANTNPNVTAQFSFNSNIRDDYYGLSYISIKPGNSVTTSDLLLVELEAFDVTQSGNCFTADSYVYSGSSLSFVDIPSYKMENGEIINLRDYLDFRPVAISTSAYATTIAAATIVTTAFSASTFSFNAIKLPVPSSTVEIFYQYNLGRKDIVYIDENGDFKLINGLESDNPKTPPYPYKGMVLAEINIPPLPSLPYAEALKINRRSYGINISLFSNKRYTMRDVGNLDARLHNLESYIALSLLEKSAADLAIQDSTGLNRFKNGIFVDNFDTLTFGDVTNNEFASALDYGKSEITPKFISFPIDLKIDSTSNVSVYSDTALLQSADVVFINQSYATKEKNCTTNFYKFTGNMQLTPEFDSGVDTINAPDIVLDINLAKPFTDFVAALSEYIPLQTSSKSIVSNFSTNGLEDSARINTVTTTTTTVNKSLNLTNKITQQNVGDFITDIRINPYMRSREVQVYISGLRPNTRFYSYFNGISVDAHMALGVLSGNNVIRSSVYGGNVLRSNSSGVLTLIFRIPSNTFYVGERKLEIFDGATYSSIDASTSYASKSYNGFNYTVEKTGLLTSTRIPVVNSSISVSSTRRISVTQGSSNHGGDPLAQTFVITGNDSSDTNIFATKIDLFFSSKSTTNGVTVELRTVDNGYPTGYTVPFSSVHLTPANINVDSVAANIATTVTFNSPVALKTDTEYAVVIKPDANDPNYKVWVAKTGEADVTTGLSITQDTNSGVLFTSTNDSAWTPYQDENLKYVLYKAEFNKTNGTVNLTDNNYEFFEIPTTTQQYKIGENVFKTINTVSGNVSVTPGNTIITGSINFQSVFSAGEYIAIKKGTAYEALKIASANTTALIVSDIPTMAVSSDQTAIYRTCAGEVAYYNLRNIPNVLVLKESSASSTLKFVAGDTIISAETGISTTITTVVDYPLSYIQPSVYVSNFSKTSTSMVGSFYNGSSNYSPNLFFGQNNYLTTAPSYIRSKSNDPSGTNKFLIALTLNNDLSTNKDTSPMVDFGISSILAYRYIINNDSTNEITIQGNAKSKYVTKIIDLADGQDAEDIKVIITAYKPINTEIEIYAKLLDATDPTLFAEIPWSKLILEKNAISSSGDLEDFKEFKYGLDTIVKTAGQGAYTANDTISYIAPNGSLYNRFKTYAIKIVYLSVDHSSAPRIKDITALALS